VVNTTIMLAVRPSPALPLCNGVPPGWSSPARWLRAFSLLWRVLRSASPPPPWLVTFLFLSVRR